MSKSILRTNYSVSARKLYQRQNRTIHQAFSFLGMPYQEQKDGWISVFRTLLGRKNINGLSVLTLSERSSVIVYLGSQGVKVKNPFLPSELADWVNGDPEQTVEVRRDPITYPGRPKSLKDGSRSSQLKKIEALLTVGKKEWNYAHALAARICKVDRVEWVPEHELYKIITALRKQAFREGWDLSGEK